MNPELPAEEMKKPSSPVAHSLVSSVQRQTGGSLPKSALCLLSTGLSAPTAGATVEGQCGCWCLELTGGGLAESGSGTPEQNGEAGTSFC